MRDGNTTKGGFDGLNGLSSGLPVLGRLDRVKADQLAEKFWLRNINTTREDRLTRSVGDQPI